MLQNNEQKKIDAAQKAYEQARARLETEKKKQGEKRRKFESHHKYMMGGAVVKYFPECYSFDEKEMNRILAAALKSEECRRIVQIIISEAERKEMEEAVKNDAGSNDLPPEPDSGETINEE